VPLHPTNCPLGMYYIYVPLLFICTVPIYNYNTLSALYILSRPGTVAVKFIRDRTRSPASIVGGRHGGRPREEVSWSCSLCCLRCRMFLHRRSFFDSCSWSLRTPSHPPSSSTISTPSSLSPRALANHRASAGRRPRQPEHERQRWHFSFPGEACPSSCLSR
jgi:hypothetical protein